MICTLGVLILVVCTAEVAAYLIPTSPTTDNGFTCVDIDGLGHLVQYASTGAAAGASRSLSRALSFPFDTMKTLQQADTRLKDTRKDQKKGVLSFREYFRGVLPIILGSIPAQATFFTTYHILEVCTSCFLSSVQVDKIDGISVDNIRFIQRLIIASLASLPTNVFKVPVEVWKQDSQLVGTDITFLQFLRLATAEARKEETRRYARGDMNRILPAVGSSGINGVYRGGYAMLLREIPFTSLQFSIYGALSEAGFFSLTDNSVLWKDTLHQSDAFHAALVGTLAAGMAAVCTQPADVIKTRMMTSRYALLERKKDSTEEDLAYLTSTEYSRTSATIRESVSNLYASRGLRGFYVGLAPRLALVCIGGFAFFGASSYVDEIFNALK